MIDFMAEDGIVGPYAGAQAREVLMTMPEWEAMKNGGEEQYRRPGDPAPGEPSRMRVAAH